MIPLAIKSDSAKKKIKAKQRRTPFPIFSVSGRPVPLPPRSLSLTRHNQWLLTEARAEAAAQGNEWVLMLFSFLLAENLPPAFQEDAHFYLFGTLENVLRYPDSTSSSLY